MRKFLAVILAVMLVAAVPAMIVSGAGVDDADYRNDTGWTKVTGGFMDPEDGVYVDIDFDAVTTTAIKFKVLDGVGGWASAAELVFNFTDGAAPGMKAGAQTFDYSEGFAEYAIDGDPSTFWHSLWNESAFYDNEPDGEFFSAGSDYPQVLIVEFDRAATLNKMSYLARPDASNGTVHEYEIWAADYTAPAVVEEAPAEAVAEAAPEEAAAPVAPPPVQAAPTASPATADMHIVIALAVLAGTAFVTIKLTRQKNRV